MTISRHSLRSSLLAGVIGLTAAALVVVGAAMALMMRGNLMGQVDEQLRGAAAVGSSLPTVEHEPALAAYVSVTTFLIEYRKPGAEPVRIHGSTPLPEEPLLDLVGDGAPEPRTIESDGQHYRVITIGADDGVVLIGASLQPVHQAVGRLIATAAVTSLIVVLALCLLARQLIKRRLRPLDEIAATATALADGHLDRRVPEPAPDDPAACTEVGRLTTAINGMLGRIQGALADRERSEDRMRTFVADASHELRTPLTAIRGYLQLVRAGVLDLRNRPDVLGRIEDESTRMGVLVNDLLFLARLDAEPTPRRTPVDLGALIRDAAADARAVEPDRPITVTGADGPGPIVPGDEDTLRQVLANLMSNVRAHTPAGAAARISVRVADDDVRVSVADDGPGLSTADAQKAFGRFWRADTARNPSGGSGLGLAIVDEIVRTHGGTVGLEPGRDAGAVAWFTLPRFPTELSSISHLPRDGQAGPVGAMDGLPANPTRGPALASKLHRLGGAMFRHRIAVIAVWLGVLLAAGVGAATLAGRTVNSFEIPGQESTIALNLIGDRFGDASAGASAQVAFEAPDGGAVTDPAAAAEIARVVGELRQLPGVVNATDPLNQEAPAISADRAAAYSTVAYAVPAPELTEDQRHALTEVVDAAEAAGMTVAVTGDATETPVEVGGPAELIGVIVALLVLALTYGSLVAAGMNLLTAVVGVGAGALGITAMTGLVDLQSTTPILAIMLGLAVGIDYALFIFTRFRHELRDGRPVGDAVAMAVGTAGSAVLTAGLTVVIALAGLAVAGIPFLTEMGLAAAATVVIAVLVALTLVPAVLGLIGRRVLPRTTRSTGFFAGWATLVTRRRWIALLVPVVLLGLVAIPFFSMRTTLQPSQPEGTTQARAEQIIADHFGPGVAGPLLVLVDGPGATDRAGQIATGAAGLPGVAAVVPPQPSPDGAAALITVIPATAPDSEETEQLVHTLRDTFGDQAGPEVYVTGTTAVGVDVAEQLDSSLPGYLLLVVGLALLLLILVFRSILVPVTAVIGFLLTIGAALGSTTAVFQWGWLADLVRAESTGPLMSLTPIIVIGILFGLAMDYQVFLVSRMHEAHAHGMAPREAVRTGFRQAAPVVVAASAIMFAVFAGFVPEGDATIKPIAFALAVGVLVDAVIVRMIFMPAALALLGRAAWWLPRWLHRMPTLDVEGAALERRPPAPEREPELTSA